jgi:hypothetical protein
MKDLPSGLEVEQWFTKESDLPTCHTNELYMIKAVWTDDPSKIVYSVAYFNHDPLRTPIDFDEWVSVRGGRCYARESEDNSFNVVAWGKLKIKE